MKVSENPMRAAAVAGRALQGGRGGPQRGTEGPQKQLGVPQLIRGDCKALKKGWDEKKYVVVVVP